jgi:hypothetical protein
VNTSVTDISGFGGAEYGTEVVSSIKALTARNRRFRHLFLYDARQKLLSLTCADECGVVWPYLLVGDDLDTMKVAPDNVATIRTEFVAVVEERHLRAAAAVRLIAADVDDTVGSTRTVNRRRLSRLTDDELWLSS